MHRIVVAPVPGKIGERGRFYTHAHPTTGLAATHHTDSLSRLCRKMVAAGLTGPATVYGPDDKPRLTVRAIERLAQKTLREDEESGFRWDEHREMPERFASEAA